MPYLFELGHLVRMRNFEGGAVFRNIKIPIYMLMLAKFVSRNKGIYVMYVNSQWIFSYQKTNFEHFND